MYIKSPSPLPSPPLPSLLQSVKINRSFDKSTAMVGDGVPEAGPRELQGLELTVWSTSDDYSIVGYIVDQIESLIDEWFPGTYEAVVNDKKCNPCSLSVLACHTPLPTCPTPFALLQV